MFRKPLILPVFLPHLGCPQHCLFCNQRATVKDVPSPQWVREFIETFLSHVPPQPGEREKQVAFYGGSFTAMSREEQVSYLNEVQPFISTARMDSIRLSTRPDALDEGTFAMLKEYGVKTVEVGVQSMADEVLHLSGRGHHAEDSSSAILRLKHWNFEVGVHLMMGLPGDTCGTFLQSLEQIIDLKPDFVRIHPTLVLKGASLEGLWRSGRYSPLTLDEAVKWLKKGMITLERASIPIARIGLQSTRELTEHLLAGPHHPALHQLVHSALFYDRAKALLQKHPDRPHPVFICHPKDLSDLKGQRNENILKLKDRFKLNDLSVFGSEKIGRRGLFLQTREGEILSDCGLLD